MAAPERSLTVVQKRSVAAELDGGARSGGAHCSSPWLQGSMVVAHGAASVGAGPDSDTCPQRQRAEQGLRMEQRHRAEQRQRHQTAWISSGPEQRQ